MPNDWFQFKQFIIHQDKCAMKVSTDACIQGAWAAKEILEGSSNPASILDIGTGTGLLSLMLAQATPKAHFDAIEINEDAFIQATENIAASNRQQQITPHHTSLSAFAEPEKKYDFIICNPPFFQNHLESGNKARNDARHSQSLSKEELAEAVYSLLNEEGIFCVLFPYTEWNNWLKVALHNGLHFYKQINIHPKYNTPPNRVIGFFTKTKQPEAIDEDFYIYDSNRAHTPEMIALLKDYYLAF